MDFDLLAIFKKSFAEFLNREHASIHRGVAERSLCSRLAMYLERDAYDAGIRGYYADVDYNRNYFDRIKTIRDGRGQVLVIFADLILHSRGEIHARDNLIAVEIKKSSRPPAEKKADRDRLHALTMQSYDGIWSVGSPELPEHVCGYELGIYIELNPEKRTYLLEEYRGGNFIAAENGSF